MHWLDPDYLPRTDGTVGRFLVNPHGDIDGILLADNTEVHVPPHLSAAIRAALKPGDAVAVYGVRPRGTEMIAAVAIEAGLGKRIVDDGPSKKHDDEHGWEAHGEHKPGTRTPALEAEGTVKRTLHGPKGEVRGALLEDGHIIRVPPHDANGRGTLLRAGTRLAARGPGLTIEGAVVIDAKEVGLSLSALEPVRKKPKDKRKHPKPPKHS